MPGFKRAVAGIESEFIRQKKLIVIIHIKTKVD